MKKVVCIKTSFSDSTTPAVVAGSIYTVIEEDSFRGDTYYVLSEMPDDCHYKSEMFAPLSDIDETELVNDYKKTEAI